MQRSLVGPEMCIRDRKNSKKFGAKRQKFCCFPQIWCRKSKNLHNLQNFRRFAPTCGWTENFHGGGIPPTERSFSGGYLTFIGVDFVIFGFMGRSPHPSSGHLIAPHIPYPSAKRGCWPGHLLAKSCIIPQPAGQGVHVSVPSNNSLIRQHLGEKMGSKNHKNGQESVPGAEPLCKIFYLLRALQRLFERNDRKVVVVMIPKLSLIHI